jgi:hypothetical protein
MFSPFRLSTAEAECRAERASTRPDTLHGRSRGRRMQGGPAGLLAAEKASQAGRQRGPEITGKSLKVRREVAPKVGREIGAPALLFAKGKNPKTFQFLSFSFIGSHSTENRVRGDLARIEH